MNKAEDLRQIRDEIFNGAHLPLYNERVKNNVYPVIGEGSHDAEIMFIGEAPGKNEAQTGRPFCGAAGKVLDDLLSSVTIPRQEVYITNILKDRPPQNRDPYPNEISAYSPYLVRQIAILKPPIIAALGRFSMSYLIQLLGIDAEHETISKLHGRAFLGQTTYGTVTFVPFYHPAVAVYNRESFELLRQDFQVLRTIRPVAS